MADIIRNQTNPDAKPFFGVSWTAEDFQIQGNDYFREVLDDLPAAIYTTDHEGRINYFNNAAVALWGRTPELGKSEWCGSWKLYWPDGTLLPHGECPMALALKEKRAIHGMEAIAERPDGSRVPFLPFPTPLYDKSGELIGAVNMLVDISDRKRAEQHAQRLASIVESCDDAIISKSLDGTILSWNPGAHRLFGYSAEEAIGKSVTMLVPAERRDEEPAIVERLKRGERINHYETVRQRKDGSLVEISLSVSPVRGDGGVMVSVARDITERKRSQEQKNLLLFEMKHRIKNSLATVQAIANQTMRSASPDEREAFSARLHSLAATYDLLTSEQWNRASLANVVAAALHPFQEKHRERFLIEGPDDIWLDSNKSLSVAMTLHELATNAVKYGALSNRSGRISVAWQNPEPHRLKLQWKERGGPPVSQPTHQGFGSRLIRATLGRDASEPQLIFDPRGLEYLVEIAL